MGIAFCNSWYSKYTINTYVTSYGHDQLLAEIETQYSKIKNNCKYAPALGENGCLEFAAGLLLYIYMIEKIYSETHDSSCSNHQKETLLSQFTSFTLIMGCAYMGATPTEWSNMADYFAEHSPLLTKREWSVVYLYLRDNYADDIRKMEFNKGNSYSHLANRPEVTEIITSARGDLEMVKKYFTSQGLLMW